MEDYQKGALGVWIIIAITVVVFAVIGLLAFWEPIILSFKTTREIALRCTTDMATQFHIHPMLKIVINGEQQEIPEDIGIADGCMKALHTHDSTGVIHVEAPVKRDFTLGDFFVVWEKPFPATATVTVNGTVVTTGESTILYDKDEIVISYDAR